MRILHTADLHLREDDSRTVDALEAVLAAAAENEVDLLTIGGDLFDSPADAESLRPRLRELFSGNPFDILAIPGNHDADVYRENLNFGNDIEILTGSPIATAEFGDLEFVGVPFTSSMDEELFSALEDASTGEDQILLLHCTLDIGFHAGEVGEEEGRYLPVTKATLAELDYDLVLAGHIHSRVREVPLDNGGTFVYPGSPVSHSTSETGRRHAILVETDTGDISTVPLDTFYHDSFSALVRPGEEDEVLAAIEDWVARREGDDCELSITVEGFIDRDENEFRAELDRVSGPVEPRDETQNATPVLEHPLYRRFEERLGERDDVPVDEDVVRQRVIEVLSRLLTQNKVQPT